MTKLEGYFASYTAFHSTKGNKITHYIGIPMIVFSTLGLLAMVRVFDLVDLRLLVWLLGSLFYCALDIKRAIPFVVLMFGFYWFSNLVSCNLPLQIIDT